MTIERLHGVLDQGLKEDAPDRKTIPTRRQRVTLLLGSYLDALGPEHVEALRRGKPSSRALGHSELWYDGSYPELDALLRQLKSQAPRVHWHTWERYVLDSGRREIRRRKAALGVEYLKRRMPPFVVVPDEVLVRGGYMAERRRVA